MKVLVLTACGLQPSALGCYGNEWLATPHFDRLAADGVALDQHYADAASPAGARLAWRSGRYRLPSAPPAAAPADDLLKRLRAQKVAAALVVDGDRPGGDAFAAGWGEVVRAEATEEASAMESALDAASALLDDWAETEHWLLWLDLGPLLPPWQPPDEYLAPYFDEEEDEPAPAEEAEEEAPPAEPPTPLFDPEPGLIEPEDDLTFARLQRTYAGAVAYLDAGLGLLLDELTERGLDEEVVVVVTADRGLPLGEHGEVGDARPWLHEERTHLPLLLRLPGATPRRVSALTQAVDLAPTLLDLFGARSASMHGHSFLPLALGEAVAVRDYAVAGMQTAAGAELCLRAPNWGMLVPIDQPDRPRLLFVKPDDRCEVNNVIQHHLDHADQLEATLRGFVAATAAAGPVAAPPLPQELAPIIG